MPDDEDVPAIDLNDGTRIPQLGFEVFKIDQGDTEETVATALSIGTSTPSIERCELSSLRPLAV